MIMPMLQQPTSPTEYAMQKPDQSIHVNKPFLLICLFTLAILSATLFTTDDVSAGDAAPAPVARLPSNKLPSRYDSSTAGCT